MTSIQFESLESRVMPAADLGIQLGDVSFHPSRWGPLIRTNITVSNTGTAKPTATVYVSLYLSTDSVLDAGDYEINFLELSGRGKDPGRTSTQFIQVIAPDDLLGTVGRNPLAAGSYHVLARLVNSHASPWTDGSEASDQNNTAIAPNLFTVQYRFGQHQAGMQQQWSGHLGTDALAWFKLTGPGIGTLENRNGRAFVTLTGTTAATSLEVSTHYFLPAPRIVLAGIQSDGPMRSIKVSKQTLGGPLVVPGSLDSLSFESFDHAAINIGGVRATAISAKQVSDTTIATSAPISSLRVSSWLGTGNNSIIAPSIHSLQCAGDFVPTMQLSGTSTTGSTLGNASILGIASGTWVVRGIAVRISLAQSTSTFAATISGKAGSLIVKYELAGVFAAASWGDITARDMRGATILAGAFLGQDAALGGEGDAADIFRGGTFSKITVQRSVAQSIVAAGVDPANAILLDTDDRFVPGGPSQIGSVTLGSMLADSRMLAVTMPRTVRVAGRFVSTLADPRFVRVLH